MAKHLDCLKTRRTLARGVLGLFVCAATATSVTRVQAQDYGIYNVHIKTSGLDDLFEAAITANTALNAGLSLDPGPPPTVNGVLLQGFNTEVLDQILAGITSWDGTAIALDMSKFQFIPSTYLDLGYEKLIGLAASLIGTIFHELAHVAWLAHYSQSCVLDPPMCLVWTNSLACHIAVAQAKGEDGVACTEAYAYEQEAEQLCALACHPDTTASKRKALKDQAETARKKCEDFAEKCAELSLPYPDGCGPLPQPPDQNGCSGPCPC